MLRFDVTTPTVANAEFAAAIDQVVDVTEYASLIATGTASFNMSAFFNRVDLDPETDDMFGLLLSAQDAAGTALDGIFLPLISDADVATWEPHVVNLVMPAETTQVRIQLNVIENIFNDLVSPEFDGHYVDDVEVWVSP